MKGEHRRGCGLGELALGERGIGRCDLGVR